MVKIDQNSCAKAKNRRILEGFADELQRYQRQANIKRKPQII
jgi:hypothetical protein